MAACCRERFGRRAALIGFGTHAGTVTCARGWDGPMEVKPVRPSLSGSYERLAHESGVGRFLLETRPGRSRRCRPAGRKGRPRPGRPACEGRQSSLMFAACATSRKRAMSWRSTSA